LEVLVLSELKMFLTIDRHFKLKMYFILLESTYIGGICIVYLNK